MTIVLILIAAFFALVFYIITLYNNLITLKNNVARNWSNIDVLLRQRYSELPKLIDTCKQYMQYEQNTLEKIVEARKVAVSASDKKDIAALSQAESTLKTNLAQLFALAENYPTLKANGSFQKLQTRISELETEISDRRELYNDSVNLNNIRLQQFPDIFVARAFKFPAFMLLKFEVNETQDVSIEKQFK